MKPTLLPFLAVLAFQLPVAGEAANAPYMPYNSVDKYYNISPPGQAAEPQQTPAAQPQQAPGLQQPKQKQPPPLTEAPQFLFPPKLGFGVAVGVPYDMIYLDKDYYFWQGGTWYRSASYRGPWTEIGYSQLPAGVRRYPLADIRQQRNKEFRQYFKNEKGYQGKVFRPGVQLKEEK